MTFGGFKKTSGSSRVGLIKDPRELADKAVNVAVAIEIGLKIPEIKGFDRGTPVLADVRGHKITYYAMWKDGMWLLPCAGFRRERLLAGDVGPIMQSSMTTVFSLNFGKFPIKEQFKKLGKILKKAKYERNEFFGIAVSLVHGELYYDEIICGPDHLTLACISELQCGEALAKGFVAGLSVFNRSLHEDSIVVCKGDTIKGAWADVYAAPIPDKMIYRTDGGRAECWMYAQLKDIARDDTV